MLDDSYKNATTKMKYICTKHPEVIQEINWNKFSLGKGCKKCGYEKVSKVLKIKKKTSYEKICKMFLEKNLELLTKEEDYYAETNPVLSFVCPCSPDLIQTKTLSAFFQSPRCSRCYKKEEKESKRLEGYKEFVRICEEKGYEPLSDCSEYINVTTKMKYRCPKHGESSISLAHLKEGKGCPRCSSSKGEKRIYQFLSDNRIEFQTQKKFEDLGALSYDFYVPGNNLLIEYQGEFHDGTVFYLGKTLQSMDGYFAQWDRDMKKQSYAKEHNYKLLEIWYWNFDNIEKILREVLNIE